MELQTKVALRHSDTELRHGDKLLLIGSCFADNMGAKLSQSGFDCLQNPFGTLYNPCSIAKALGMALDGRTIGPESAEVFESGGQWHSWMHHSRFSAATRDELTGGMNESLRATAAQLGEASHIIVTLGSAYVYRLKATGEVVANCHKQSEKLFDRSRLSVEAIVEEWDKLVGRLVELNPGVRLILTVSPIRHKRDGLHANQLSKSTLLLAADRLCESHPKTCQYFPSYEIVMDELRDYRFYADDMVHPSTMAVDYIWEKFAETYMSKPTQEIAAECRKVTAALEHRPFNPGGEEYRRFLTAVRDRMERLRQEHGAHFDMR